MDIGTLHLDSKIDKRSLIFQCISGSHAYGTSHSNSDIDTRGIFISSSFSYLSLTPPVKSISDKKQDHVYYTLFRFLQLAADANPNIIECLYMPEDCITLSTPFMDRIIDQRALFITQKACDSHLGFAHAQIKKARAQNKRVNRPQPIEPLNHEDFCWVLLHDKDKSSAPGRPAPLKKSGLESSQCHVASLEHAPNMYRLYHIGKQARGIFSDGNIVCQSISAAEEVQSFIGFFIFNKQGYESAMKDHRHYWEWQQNRNQHRWVNQELGQLDYDAKNMLHLFRLLLSANHILREGAPLVRFSGEKLDFLKNILAGHYSYNELIAMADEKVQELTLLKKKSTLPEQANLGKIDNLLRELTFSWESQYAK